MASISANGSRGHHKFTLNVVETSVNTSNNTSAISFSLVLTPIVKGYDWNYTNNVPVTYSININGTTYSGNIMKYDGSSTVTIRSGSQTVSHNADGSKSMGFSFSISEKISATWLPGNASSSGSMTLTKIARQANLTAAPNFNDEQNPTITYSNPAGNNVSSLQACISLTGAKDDIVYRDISKTGTSYTFELTDEERELLRSATPTSNSLSVKFYVKTVISGSTFYSILNRTMTIVNANPIFSEFSYKDINSTAVSVTGNNQVLIKGISTLQTTILAEDKMTTLKEATPKNYNISIDTINKSVDYSTENLVTSIGVVRASGIQQLNVRAYDSRNNSVLASKNVQVYDYEPFTVNATIERLNNWENESTLKVDGEYSRIIIDDVDKNTIISGSYRYAEKDGTWSTWKNLTITVNEGKYICDDVILNLDNTKEFTIQVSIADRLKSTITSIKLGVGKPIFFISSNQEECYINGKKVVTEGGDKYAENLVPIEIGTWINGEKHYRIAKTNITMPSSTGVIHYDFTNDIGASLVYATSARLILFKSNGMITREIVGNNPSGNSIEVTNGEVFITLASSFSGFIGTLIMEYTLNN